MDVGGGSGENTYKVVGVTGGKSVVLEGGSRRDRFEVDPIGGDLDFIDGSLLALGGGDFDVMTVNDAGNLGSATYTLADGFLSHELTRSGSAAARRLSGHGRRGRRRRWGECRHRHVEHRERPGGHLGESGGRAGQERLLRQPLGAEPRHDPGHPGRVRQHPDRRLPHRVRPGQPLRRHLRDPARHVQADQPGGGDRHPQQHRAGDAPGEQRRQHVRDSADRRCPNRGPLRRRRGRYLPRQLVHEEPGHDRGPGERRRRGRRRGRRGADRRPLQRRGRNLHARRVAPDPPGRSRPGSATRAWNG